MGDKADFSFTIASTSVPNGLPQIHTRDEKSKEPVDVCTDDSVPTVKAKTLDELHALQKKRSAPSTPRTPKTPNLQMSEEELQRQQLQSISASLASLTRQTGPKVVRGDPDRIGETAERKFEHSKPHHLLEPVMSDSALKYTHILYNLSPAELYEQAIKYEKGTFITSTGALATLSGARTGRSPRDKRVVRDELTEGDLWWGKGSPNIEMDEHTFLVNRERAVDYLNSLEKVFVNDQFLNWDPEHRIKVRIITARAYHALFMHNM